MFYGGKEGLSGFLVEGHAGAGAQGTDMVCAAGSSAVYFAANTITDVLRLPAQTAVEEGRLALSLPGANLAQGQWLLQGLKLHLEALAQQYPRSITVTFLEV